MDKTEYEEGLIDLVRQNPLLWAKNFDDYRNAPKKEATWTAIGEALNKPASECRATWTSLRAQYFAFLKKIDFPTGSGRGRRPYFRYEGSMEFCREKASSNNSFSNVIENENSSEVILTSQLPEGEVLFEFEEPPSPMSPPASVVPMVHSAATKTRVHAKQTTKRKLDAVDEKLLRALNSQDSKEDEWDYFGRSLAMKLRRLNEQKRGIGTIAEARILKLLDLESGEIAD